MTWRGFFEGIGDVSQWAFGGVKFLGEGFNGIGFFNVFWILMIATLVFYWLGQMRLHAKRGER